MIRATYHLYCDSEPSCGNELPGMHSNRAASQYADTHGWVCTNARQVEALAEWLCPDCFWKGKDEQTSGD